MSQNFLTCDRDQSLLLPPNLREWLPEDHLAWFVLDAIEELDLTAFYDEYRKDGGGRAAFDPSMMVALLIYAYAIGERSSRAIERRCREDIAFRVITANQMPDHATIARFRVRHEAGLAGLFTDVLRLCAQVGLASVGVIAIDGTKLRANASMAANRSYASIAEEVQEILSEAAAADAKDNEQLGERRGDELPAQLVDRRSRRARLRAAKARLEGEVQDAKQAHRKRLRARAAHERQRGGKLRGRKPTPPASAVDPAARANITDPDSRLLRGAQGFVQGYNAQAATNEHQIILAAELSTDSPDGRLLEPMVAAAQDELRALGIEDPPEVVLADGGYWNVPQIEAVVARGSQVLVNPDASTRPVRRADGRRLRDKRVAGLYAHMQRVITSEHGRALYGRRQIMIEPVFAHAKVIRRADRFQRRGIAACRAGWRLIAATHNLLKLWRHAPATA